MEENARPLDIVVTLDSSVISRAVLARAADVAARVTVPTDARAATAALASAPTAGDLPRWLRGGIWAFDLASVELFANLDESTPGIRALDRHDADPLAPVVDPRGVAVIPIHGFITRRASFWSALFGGTSLVELEDAVRAAVNDSRVHAIVLDVDSPGGSVTGVHETFEVLRAANAVKPIHAAVSGLGASAAYWLASAASSIAVSPSAEVGSIGVFGMHADRSAFFQARGITFSVFAVPAAKAEATDVVPLTDDARDAMRARVESHYRRFVDDVATGRGVSAAEVRGGFGGGRVVGSDAALAARLVDTIATPSAVLGRVADTLADSARRLELARYRAG